MVALYSYVVDHDHGFAPHPSGRYCTLVHCKFGGERGKRNIVEIANVGDWILGTGGQSRLSAGNGRIIYLMRVDEKLCFKNYLTDRRFLGRADCLDRGTGNKYALVSESFWYFGRSAIPVSRVPQFRCSHPLEKKGPGFRSDFSEASVERLTSWFQKTYETGIYDEPCSPIPVLKQGFRGCRGNLLKNRRRCKPVVGHVSRVIK